MLRQELGTFFWNSNWFEVVCQYSRVPSECVAMTVFLMVELDEVLARQVMGLLSSLTRLYLTSFLLME